MLPLENPGVPPPLGNSFARGERAAITRARASSREESRTEDDGRRARRDSAFARVTSRRETTDDDGREDSRVGTRERAWTETRAWGRTDDGDPCVVSPL